MERKLKAHFMVAAIFSVRNLGLNKNRHLFVHPFTQFMREGMTKSAHDSNDI